MTRLRGRRDLILKGFELALKGKHQTLVRGLLERAPPDAMNWHTVHVIVARTMTLREYPQYKGSAMLRPAVRRALAEVNVPHEVRYPYEVVTLCSYNIVWQYVSAVRRKWRTRTKEHAARLAAAEKAA